MKRTLSLILLFVFAYTATGCVYAKDRALDFGDCFSFKAGYGIASAGANVFGVFYMSAGGSVGERWGVIGRHAVYEDYTVLGVPVANVAMPVLGIVLWDDNFFKNTRIFVCIGPISSGMELVETNWGDKEEMFEYGVMGVGGINAGFCLSDIRGEVMEEPFLARHYFDLKLHACLGLMVEVGFSPAEFADFMLGWFGADIAGDDAKTEKDEKKAEPEEEK